MQHDNSDDTTEVTDEIPLLLMTNEPTELKLKTLELLYQSLAYGQLAYMDGKDPETGAIIPLLVGLQPEENNKVSIYPLAKLITKEDKTNYLIPDGKGNYTSVNVGESIDLGIEYSDDPTASATGNTSSGKAASWPPEGISKTIH